MGTPLGKPGGDRGRVVIIYLLAPMFNAAFSLSGNTVPEPGTLVLMGFGLVALVAWHRHKKGEQNFPYNLTDCK
jgi:hypothetical protein